MKDRKKEINKLENFLSGKNTKKSKIFIKKLFFMFFYRLILTIARIFEIITAFFIFISATCPAFIILVIRKTIFGKSIFIPENIYGLHGKTMRIMYFNLSSSVLKNLSLLFHVFSGKLALVGVSIKTIEKEQREAGDAYIYNNKPGIFNLWYVRESGKIAHEGKLEIEKEYISNRTLTGDIILILKSIPAYLYHVNTESFSDKINLFGMTFMNLGMKEAVEIIKQAVKNKFKKKIYFVNPDCLNTIFTDSEYLNVLNKGDYVFPDGIGINIACRIIKNPLKENVNGTDMLPFLCTMLSDNKYSMYLLGAKPGIAEKMKKRLEKKYPELNIAGYRDGYFNRKTENKQVIESINKSEAEVLLIAFGAPNQEKWIHENADKLNCNVLIGVGGLFDFYSGNIKRAPKWMREIGLEWFYRLIQEPGRMWRRYIIGNPLFVFRVIKWKFSEQ